MSRARLISAALSSIVLVGPQVSYQRPDAFGSEQTPKQSARLAFEVASVKTNASGITRATYRRSRSSFIATNAPLQTLLAFAYEVATPDIRFRFVGGPERLLSTRYDVQAKLPEGASPLDIPEMLTNLLRDRFKLRVHAETRQLHVYGLVVLRKDQLGSQLRKSDLDCDVLYESGGRPSDPDTPRDAKNRRICFDNYALNPNAFGIHYASTLDRFIQRIQGFVDRPIINATGLSGAFAWELVFDMTDSDSSEAPTIFTAIREQLGLKLEPRDGPVDVFVIDSVEPPTPD